MSLIDIELRDAGLNDLDLVLELMRELYASDKMLFEERTARRALLVLLADRSLGSVMLVARDSEVIGYAALTLGYSLEFGGSFYVLDELFIRDEHRGRGSGWQVLAVIKEDARMRGLHAIRLEVGRTNVRAQDLYRRVGFEAHDRDLMTFRIDLRGKRR